jgi:ubiquinone/menaquinone biosynthesis C-methylase UbiE
MMDEILAEQTDFGFRAVPRAEKKNLVREVFASVAPRYDLMNDLMSLGIHRVWKQIFTTLLDPRPRRTLLDLAGGTGDISFGWLAKGGGPAILSDINPAMLEVGRDRAIERGYVGNLSFLVADAESLPVPSGSLDVVSSSRASRWRHSFLYMRLGPSTCSRASGASSPETPTAIGIWRRASACSRTSRRSPR